LLLALALGAKQLRFLPIKRSSLLLGAVLIACSMPARDAAARGATPQMPVAPTRGHVATSEHGNAVGARAYTSLWAAYNALRGDAYALDSAVRRHPDVRTALKCDASALIDYRGEKLSYGGPVRVHPAFAERLRRFEAIAAEVGVEVYGRAPTKVRHFGTYSCRNARSRSQRLSEHALGNAIDVAGFDFGPASKQQRAALPAAQRLGFQVRVDKHFNATKGELALLHREFLRRLVARLERDAAFRVLLGPNHVGHENHFHFDMSPWFYYDV
jgi:hypothetical protein